MHLHKFAISLALTFTTERARACRMLEPFKESDKAKAEIVFIGKVTDYQLAASRESAKVTFKVIRTLKGEQRKEWIVSVAQNINTSVPKTIASFRRCFGSESEVGLIKAATKENAPTAVQGTCDPPYILSTSGKTDQQDCLFD